MHFIQDIKEILLQAREKTYQAINTAMVEAYWNIGKKIVLEEQNVKERASYGSEIIKNLSKELTLEFGKGFSKRSLREYIQFYILLPSYEIQQTVFAILNWSHFQRVLRISNEEVRNYYLKEAAENTWPVRVLDRNTSTLYYQRLLSSQNKEAVKNEMVEKTENNNQLDFIKNPSVLGFLNLPNNWSYTELELEKALIDNIQKFILELGKGFAFVERQQLIRTEISDFYVDLVFYNFILKFFVIIELKINKISHQDIRQLDMYAKLYDHLKNKNQIIQQLKFYFVQKRIKPLQNIPY
jgi:predicted nuclease of restriction endonuclease-like (RecB) superfamily